MKNLSNSVWKIELANGVKIPILGLGTYKTNGEEVKNAVRMALDIGYRHFDTADIYQNLEPIGEALSEALSTGRIHRSDLFITTKVWPTYYGIGRVQSSVHRMLKQIQLDYFDLVLLHWPVVMADSDTERYPVDAKTGKIALSKRRLSDIWLDLEKVYQAGLCRSIGVSNFNSIQLEKVIKVATVPPVINQVECHLYFAQFKLQQFCAKHSVFLTAYYPLASGGHHPGEHPNLLQDPKLAIIAAKYHKTPAQVAIRWLLQRGIIAIPKSVHRERQECNFRVFDFEISDEDCETLDRMDRGPEGRLANFDKNGTLQSPEYPFHIEF